MQWCCTTWFFTIFILYVCVRVCSTEVATQCKWKLLFIIDDALSSTLDMLNKVSDSSCGMLHFMQQIGMSANTGLNHKVLQFSLKWSMQMQEGRMNDIRCKIVNHKEWKGSSWSPLWCIPLGSKSHILVGLLWKEWGYPCKLHVLYSLPHVKLNFILNVIQTSYQATNLVQCVMYCHFLV